MLDRLIIDMGFCPFELFIWEYDNCGILNLGTVKFILIDHILGLLGSTCILVISLKFLDWGLWHVGYFYWVIFVNLGLF